MDKDNPKEPKAESPDPEVKDEPLLEDEPAATDPNKTVGELAGDEQAEAESADPVAAASQALSENEPLEQKPPKPKRSKKPLVIILVLLLLAGAGYGAWYYYNNYYKDTKPAATEQTAETEAPVLTYEPTAVVYAFRESEDVPYALYWRPAGGGERAEVMKLDRDDGVSNSDVYGNNVVFQSNKGIFVSTDSGQSYNQVMQLNAEEQITSIKFANDGSKIVFGHLPDVNGKNTVKSMDLDGQNVTDLFTSEEPGIYILGYLVGEKKIIFNRGCYNCDGNLTDPYLRNLASNEETRLITPESGQVMFKAVPSYDLNKVVYVYGGEPVSDDPFALPLTPYTIAVLDVASGESTTITTVGETNETNPNGTPKSRDTLVGFLAGSNTVYYTDESQLFTFQSNTPTLAYESKDTILYVPFINDSAVIAGSGANTGNYALMNYNIKTQKAADIFSGDNNTFILGVTTN